MRANNFALRLPRPLLAARKTARQFLAGRAQRGSPEAALRSSNRPGAISRRRELDASPIIEEPTA